MKQLRALIAEDSQDDFDLLVRAIGRAGYTVNASRVDTADAMQSALRSGSWDIVFSDWSMPSFSAMDALALLRAAGIDLPFIIVSGTIGEDIAVEALRAGAHDFMSKDKLTRLGPAIERELREVETRRERNRMHEQLMISDRMASIGLLAAGVAHEINNPLSAVIANLDLALDDLEALARSSGPAQLVDDLRLELSDARSGADRVRAIVRDLRIFSRSESETYGPVNVQAVLESTLRMASNELRHRAKVVTDYVELRPVLGSEARLGQLCLNLIVNAAQAIPEGKANKNEVRVRTRSEESRARIEIEDTGTGISPEMLKRLFVPFATTKPAGVGTGLGLSICQRIVTELGGDISVESQLGVGAKFIVRLPFAERTIPETQTREVVDHKPRRRASILVIDDEAMIGAAIQRSVTREHHVTCLQSAREAIARIRSGERFDVIVSDLMMPEMTGMDLHAELLQIAPDQATAIIFLTGGAFTEQARAFLDRVPNQRLEKPFGPRALRALINGRVNRA